VNNSVTLKPHAAYLLAFLSFWYFWISNQRHVVVWIGVLVRIVIPWYNH